MRTRNDRKLKEYKTGVRQRSGYSYQLIKSGKPFHVEDTEQDPQINPVMREKGRKAVLGVPLIGRETPVGVLWVHWKMSRRISEREENLLMALASQAAVAIENVRLFEQRDDNSQALQKVGASLTAPIELTEVLHRVLVAASNWSMEMRLRYCFMMKDEMSLTPRH